MAVLLFLLAFFLTACLSAILTVVEMVLSVLHVGYVMWREVLIFAALIVLIPLVWRFLRAVFGRIRFAARMKSVCRKGGYSCVFLRNPLTSLLLRDGAYDVLIDTGDRRFAVKFFPGNVAHRFVHLRGLTLAETEKYYIMPVVYPLRLGKMDILRLRANRAVEKEEFFINEMTYAKKSRKYRMDVAENATPILLFHPEPMRLTGVVANAAKPLGSGEEYEGVTLYEGDGWLRYLNRLALE